MIRPVKKVKKSNHKYGNTPLTYKGIKFKSKLEVFMYKQLEVLGQPFEYEGKSYTVMEGFVYQGSKIRPITYTPDFRLKRFPVIIETKGIMSPSFPLRFKLFKKHLIDTNDVCDLFMPRNQKDCLKVIKQIKEKYHV